MSDQVASGNPTQADLPPTFREALQALIWHAHFYSDTGDTLAGEILDMPEMQAIRRVLHGMSVCSGIESKAGMLLDSFDLPDAVRDWARGPVVGMEFGFLSLPDTDEETSS